jgi:hypothetical protein
MLQLCKFSVKDIIVQLLYRSPSAPQESISEIATVVRAAEKNSIILGDFNIPDIDWTRGMARGRSVELLDAVEECLMEQLVEFPTHLKGNTLDLIITNMPERVVEVREEGRLGRSDHVITVTKITMGASSQEEKPPYPDWQRADWEAMRKELLDTTWRNGLADMPTELAWNTFAEKVKHLMDKYIPCRRRRNQNRPKWMSTEIMRAIRKKKRLWKVVKDGQITEEYKRVEKSVKNMIRKAKRKFERKLAAGGEANRRPFFAYVKQKTKTRLAVGPLKDQSGNTVADDVGMANLLNGTFKAVFTRENAGEVPELEELPHQRKLRTVKFTAKVVKKKIADLRTDAAAGPDGIGPRVLQELACGLAPALVEIFTKSLRDGVVPEAWKDANVTPIFKKGAKSSPENYRPVSLTSVCCKVMESIIRDAVSNHLTENGLIRSSQHGFMKGRSCATNLLEFLEAATTAVDRGEAFDAVYLDFAKAFDKVPHQRLLKKMAAHGCQERSEDG